MTDPGKNILYVALGPLRIRAAQEYAAKLAADRAQVRLVVADRPEWHGFEPPVGVTVQRIGSAELIDTLRAARLYFDRPTGPLSQADLLLVGDPEAMPVALIAAQRHPKLAIRLEPTAEPQRRAAPADLAVLTPWYTSPNNALAGAFVRASIRAVQRHFDRISILHTEEQAFNLKGLPGKAVSVAVDRQAAATPSSVVLDTPEGELTRVAVPTIAGTEYGPRARAHVAQLRAALPTGRIEAPLIHAHTGIYSGVVATELARDDARLIVTEHSTFLGRVFGQRAARQLYERVLDRADLFLCVSRNLYDLVTNQFPAYAGKVRIVPNAIDFDDFTPRPEPLQEPLRWLYVGRMLEHKGVRTLVDGFARIATEEPRATLTLVGSGQLEGELRRRISELDLADRIELRPAVPPEQVTGVMHDHDLLVHASRIETFGMTVVEAAATGTPVLVARSEGPAETLAGVERLAGLLFDVGDDPDIIAEAYRTLRSRFDQLDLSAARAGLLAKYGREVVGTQLMAVYRPEESPGPVPAPAVPTPQTGPAAVPAAVTPASGNRVIMIAVGPLWIRRVVDFAQRAAAGGFSVDIITDDPDLFPRNWPYPEIRVHGITDADRSLVYQTEQLVVHRAPGKLLEMAGGGARRLRLRNPWLEASIRHAQQGHRKISGALHRKAFNRGYQLLRARALWRIVKREILPRLDLDRTRLVVVPGTQGVVIGSQLARLHPHLTVTISTASLPTNSPRSAG